MPWLSPRYGGPAISVPQAAVRLLEMGHDVEIVATNADPLGVLDVPTGRLVDWAGAPATFHPVSAPHRYLTSWPMLADLRRRAASFDLIHIHCLYRFHGPAAALVARANGVPYIVQPHGTLDPWHRRRRGRAKDAYHLLVEDRIIAGARGLVCNSSREHEFIRKLGYELPVWVIPVGIDAEELRAPSEVGFPLGGEAPVDDQIVTFLGRISASKGVKQLVQAFQATSASFPKAHLVIAGPDDEGMVRDLLPLIQVGDMAPRVTIPGLLSGTAKRALLQRSSVFVLASADESFGIAVAEAMAVGCPVVVSPEVAIAAVVGASGAGLVAAREPAAIATAIGTILGSPTLAARMGAAGRQAVDDRFSWPVVLPQMNAMYQSIVAVTPMPDVRLEAETPVRAAFDLDIDLRCPQCRQPLRRDSKTGDGWRCTACTWVSSIAEPIPILLPDASQATAHDDAGPHGGMEHVGSQASHFDNVAGAAFEIDRPHGTPRLYRHLLTEKFRRAVRPIRPHLQGATALIVCGGSGMDAEFLARAGASVTTSDISLGAATRAVERSKRYGAAMKIVVADAEHLPFANESVDLVFVHDGLHHLADPYAGLSEMARVARKWVVVTEPAQALLTEVAIRLGLALRTEEAGNRVARLRPSEVAAFLEACGYRILKAERYAMYYRHRPGRWESLLSRPMLFPLVRLGWSLANGLLGRFGNKMVIVAERTTSATTA